jgi:glutamine amidotransferase
MCRWLGYFGSPILPKELISDPERSLIEQSRRAGPHMSTTNGDGFGLGWYGPRDRPALFRSATPAWGDENLRELTAAIETPLFLAHVRAATGTPVQQTNCHPFRYGRWLFVHNGYIADHQRLRRDLLFAVRPDLFTNIRGSTDSELMFHLALTFGLEDDPPTAVARALGLIEAEGKRRGIKDAFQGTIATTNGEHLWAFRYATYDTPRSLFFSKDVRTLRELYPEREVLQQVSDDARLVLSEPIGDLPGAWHEMPESSWGMVGQGDAELMPFRPIAPTVSAPVEAAPA